MNRLPSSGIEWLALFTMLVGVVTLAVIVVSVLWTAVTWVLTPSAQNTVASGLPWFIGGMWAGALGTCVYIGRQKDD